MKNILVFSGGNSPERDVSVITGALALNSLDKTVFNPVPVYVDVSGRWFTGERLFNIDNYKTLDYLKLKEVALFPDGVLYAVKGKRGGKRVCRPVCRAAAALNCMHGGFGEDGSLSGMLSLCGVPLASPSVLPCAFAMDKDAAKFALKGLGVSVLPHVSFGVNDGFGGKRACGKALPFDFPVIVKPARGGSSIGINRADDEEQLENALSYALRFGEKAIVEPFVTDFTEINCAAFRKKSGEITVSLCERPVKRGDILSFADKYEGGTHVFPADIPSEVSDEIRRLTKKVYAAFGFDGVVRIDFMLIDGAVVLNEINAVPGSLAYYLFCNTLKGFSAMLTELIAAAEEKARTEKLYLKRFDSGILSVGGAKGAKSQRE